MSPFACTSLAGGINKKKRQQGSTEEEEKKKEVEGEEADGGRGTFTSKCHQSRGRIYIYILTENKGLLP